MPADGSKSDVLLALVASLSSAAATLWAAASTGSAALFATGVLFLAAGSSQALMLLALGSTQRAAQTLGKHNADLYVWSFVAALILFSLGAGVAVYEGIGKITDAPRILLRSNNAYAALAVAFTLTVAAHVGALAVANTAARPPASAPVLVTTRIETIAALAGLVIAGLGITVSYAWDSRFADGAAAILVGLVIGTVASVMGVEIRRLLMDDARTSETTVSTDAPHAAKDNAEKKHAETEPRVPGREAGHDEKLPTPASVLSEKEKAPPRLSRRAKKRREQQQRRHAQQGSDT